MALEQPPRCHRCGDPLRYVTVVERPFYHVVDYSWGEDTSDGERSWAYLPCNQAFTETGRFRRRRICGVCQAPLSKANREWFDEHERLAPPSAP